MRRPASPARRRPRRKLPHTHLKHNVSCVLKIYNYIKAPCLISVSLLKQKRNQAMARRTEATRVGTSRISDMVPSPLMVAPEMPATLPM